MKKSLSFALTLLLGIFIGMVGLSCVTGYAAPSGTDKTAMPTNDPIYINGQKVNIDVYKIDGSNYFKLRDLGRALDFYVGWSREQGVYIEGDKPYEEETSSASNPSAELFDRLNGKSFNFASGVGAWNTEVTFGPDGTFEGNYHDSDMGDDGPSYPYGTVYLCNFSGSFSDAVRIDDFTYSMHLKDISLQNTPGQIEVRDSLRLIYSEPYGMDDADLFYIYLPGRSTGDLPEQYLEWICMPNAWAKPPATLSFWGMYNVGGEEGFFS